MLCLSCVLSHGQRHSLCQEVHLVSIFPLFNSLLPFYVRYIDSYTYDEKQESYHPRDTFIESADTELYNAAIACDWNECPHLCSNVSLLLAVISLKKNQPERGAFPFAMFVEFL